MRLLIITPLKPENESSFIKAQINHLNPFKILYSGYKPYLVDGNSIFKFPFNINIFRIFVKRIFPPLYTSLYNRALIKFLIKYKIDISIVNYGPQSANVVTSFKKLGIPLICHFYGYDAFIYKTIKKYSIKYLELFNYSSAIISVSKDMSNQLIKLGANKDKVILNACGIDTEFFQESFPQINGRFLIFIGRFTEKKAPDLLILAFHYALQKVPDAKLIMVGNGELYHKINKLINKLGIQESILLKGWQTQTNYIQDLKNARVYVQHSQFAENGDSEGTPVSIIEAAGCGLPVISTSHGGIKDVIQHGISGFLVDEGDWQSMGDYMIKLLLDPELAGILGKNARQNVLINFSVDKQMDVLKFLLTKFKKNNER